MQLSIRVPIAMVLIICLRYALIDAYLVNFEDSKSSPVVLSIHMSIC